MKRFIQTLCLALATLPAIAQTIPEDIRAVVETVKHYDFAQPRKPLFALDDYSARVTGNVAQQKAFAALLATSLADPGVSPVAKTIFCQKLAFVGTDDEVPALAKLLDDSKLSDPARLALDGMRLETADAALRAALDRLGGQQLIGVINSLGGRRDAASVSSLTKLLGGTNHDVAAAAAHALGVIATKEAAASLAKTDFNDDRLTCAQVILKGDAGIPARDIIQLIGSVSINSTSAATRIAALSVLAQTRSSDALTLLAKAANDSDALVSASAVRFLGKIPGADAAKCLTDLLAKAAGPQLDVTLAVLAERRATSARDPVERMMDDKNEAVRLAAIQALASLGNAATAKKLAVIVIGDNAVLRKAAEEALGSMPDAGVDEFVRSGIASGEPETRAAMIRIATARNCPNIDGALLAAATDANEVVAAAAIRALGRAGTTETYPRVVDLLASSKSDAARNATVEALRDLGRRMSDPAARVAQLRAMLARTGLSPEAVAAALGALASAGGSDALAVVKENVTSTDPSIREAAIRALAQWSDAAAMNDLVSLVEKTTNETHRALALRGAFRLASMADKPMDRITQLKPLIRGADEKKLLLATLAGIASAASLDEAVAQLADKDVSAEAASAAVAIGRALVKSDPTRVGAAMAGILAANATGPAADEARVLQAGVKGKSEEDVVRARQRTDELAKSLGAGGKVAGYLECGASGETRLPNGVSIKVVRGAPYKWPGGSSPAEAAAATVAFAGEEVRLKVGGIDAQKYLELNFVWWDYDANGRKQSVWIGSKRVVDPVDLPAWEGKQQGPATLHCAVPADAIHNGGFEIAFRAEGKGNAVVSEVWLVEKNGSAPPARSVSKAAPTKHALIVTGMEYPGHKWSETAPFLRDSISEDQRIAVSINEDAKAALESPALASNDVIVMNYMNWQNPGPGEAAQEGLRKAVANGTGLVLVHFACGAFQTWPEFVKIAGRVWNPKFRGHDARGPFTVKIVDAQHEITKGFAAFATDDELYTCLDGNTPIHILADANSTVDKKDYPMAFVLQYGKGRVFMSTLGHDVKALSFPDVKNLYRRATAWAAGLEPK